jgi:inosine-uridine nucleoside N-ribohydrolase
MRIWIDTDCALGAPRGDVDDGFALAAVALDGGAELLGVSSVFGNTSAARAAGCARRLLERVGCRAQVVEGAARAGQVTAAAEAIAALPAGTELLALGPLTNLHQALLRDPDLAHRITLRAVGGNLATFGRWPPLWPFEFNLAKDAPAARAVMAQPELERRLFPLDACRRLRVGARGLARLAGRGDVGSFLAARSLRWLLRSPLRYGRLAFPLWDLVPALELTGRLAGARFEPRALRLEGRGRLVPGGRPALWLRDFDVDLSWYNFSYLCGNS